MPLILPRRSLWLPPRFRKGFHRFSPGCTCCDEVNDCTDCSGTTYPLEIQITVPAGVFTDDFCLFCDDYDGTFVLTYASNFPDCIWGYTGSPGQGCVTTLAWAMQMNTTLSQWELKTDSDTTLWTFPYTPPVDCNTLDIELAWDSSLPAEACIIDTGLTINAVAL